MNLIEFWNKLAVAALLGSHHDGELSLSEPFPPGLVESLREETREGRLLTAAAFTDVYLRAGVVLENAEPTLIPAAATESLTPVNAGADAHLAILLTGEHDGVLAQWLAAAAKAEKRAHFRHLPNLLKLAVKDRSLAENIRKVAGQRGAWLAGRNTAWNGIFSTDDASIWETGNLRDRKAVLRQKRSTDAAGARLMLEMLWNKESAEAREAFVEVMWTGLSMADAQFLNTACQDRHKAVRSAAAKLLMALPESEFSRGLQARLEVLLQIGGTEKSKILKKSQPRLIVQLPQAGDNGADHWCPAVPAGSTVGERAWQLAQMMPAVAPRYWQHKWDMNAQQILILADKHEFEMALLYGWSSAAVIHRDATWCECLIRTWLGPKCVNMDYQRQIRKLVKAISPTERETSLQRLLGEIIGGSRMMDGLVLLEAADHDWSIGFSRFVVTFLHQMAGDQQNKSALRHCAPIGLCIHPAVANLLVEATVHDGASGAPATGWSQTVAMVVFRNQMFKELA